jgi:hypothetical protein
MGNRPGWSAEIAWPRRFHRPVICTEYMARSVGSTFDARLPIAKQERVGAIDWGFETGKTQTYYPWESPASGMSSRGAALRRHAVPADGSGFDSAS